MAPWHAQQGFKLSASLSGDSKHWARDAWEPLRHRVSMMWVVLVGNAREERFPSEFTRLGHSVLVKSSGKSALVLSCRPHSRVLAPSCPWEPGDSSLQQAGLTHGQEV